MADYAQNTHTQLKLKWPVFWSKFWSFTFHSRFATFKVQHFNQALALKLSRCKNTLKIPFCKLHILHRHKSSACKHQLWPLYVFLPSLPEIKPCIAGISRKHLVFNLPLSSSKKLLAVVYGPGHKTLKPLEVCQGLH